MVKQRKSIAIAAVILFIVFGLAGCKPHPVESIEFYLDFSLPADMEVLHNYQPIGFIQGGRQPQYTVFQLQERPSSFLSENGFVAGTSPEEIPTDWLYGYEKYDVPSDYYPPWEEEFMWARVYPVNLVYFEAPKWLIIIVERN